MTEGIAIPKTVYWKGRPASELSREELLEALAYQTEALERAHRAHDETLALVRAFSRPK